MVLIQRKDKVNFRNTEITIDIEKYKCKTCGFEGTTVEQGARIQKTIADTYREKVGLLTGSEIKTKRKELGLTQQQLADRAGIGVINIKRWEGGLIQSRVYDKLIRVALGNEAANSCQDIYNGNRELSLSRIKLIINEFSRRLKYDLFDENDENERLLYVAKYLFYADMKAYKELGASMTGAHYARLPHGPQIDNYSELIDEIKKADENDADPLDLEERRIISKLAKRWPDKYELFEASHKEPALKTVPTGWSINYDIADKLKHVL